MDTENPLAFRDAYIGVTEVRSRAFDGCELREAPDGTGGSVLTFTGYASVTESPYEMTDSLGSYSETISRSAFDRTLAEGPDVNFLLNHEGVSLARTKAGTLRLSVDDTGLYTEARLDPTRPDVQILRSAVSTGALDEMSFAFRVNRQTWDEDYTKRQIEEVNLHHGDVSAVNYGANPHTAGMVGLRSLITTGERPDAEWRQILDALGEMPADEVVRRLSLPLPTLDEVIEESQPPIRLSTDLLRAKAHALRLRGQQL